MELKTWVKEPFSVIGKEIFTWDGDGLVPKVWANVQKQFSEIEPLVLKDAQGRPLGKWGAMSSRRRDFSMWEKNGSVGLYLAGYEVAPDVQAPEGWVRWDVPGFEFRLGKIEGENYFYRALEVLNAQGTPVVAATENWFDPDTDEPYFAFPVRWL